MCKTRGFFFFSSRRRHTRCGRDWSSDVCSSDLRQTGQGGPVEWHKMGAGWSWSRKQGTEDDHAEAAREGWREITRRLAEERHTLYVLDEFTYPMAWGWVDVAEVVATLRDRPG